MDILSTISDFGKTVAQKSSDFAESSKLTMNIKKKEHDIKAIYAQIGQYVFDQHANGAVYDENITAMCNQIDEAFAEIDNFKADKESIGINNIDVEVVETTDSDTENDFEITPEDEEILKDL